MAVGITSMLGFHVLVNVGHDNGRYAGYGYSASAHELRRKLTAYEYNVSWTADEYSHETTDAAFLAPLEKTAMS